MKPENKKINKNIQKGEELAKQCEAELIDSEDFRGKTLEPLRIAVKGVLEGQTASTIRGMLLEKGYKTNMDKVWRLIRLAKKQIAKRAEMDLNVNYAWVQENLLDIHAKCVDDEDTRTRLVVINQLMKLWQLDVQRVEQVKLEVSKEKMEEYERMLFGG